MTSFKPLGNFVLVSPVEKPDTTPSGLVLPESTKEKPNHGIVMVVGEGQRNENGETIPVQVKVNDHVLFQKYAGVEVTLDGKKYLLIRETDLLGIIISDQ